MKPLSYILILFTISLITCIKLNNNNPINQLELQAQINIHRLKSRLHTLSKDTSCKVASKYALLLLCNVKSKKELHQLNVDPNSIDNTLLQMRSLLLKGNILHVETKTNHHFILFMKNSTDVYLIQAFYTFYRLEDWMMNKELMKPYLTIDDFFNKFKALLDYKNTSKRDLDDLVLELFLPKALNKDEEKQKKMIEYFKRKVSLVRVGYAPVDYGIRLTGKDFTKLLKEISHRFQI